ncbi:hypothetical protein F0Q45_26465, partial [Mycobacterium simiae]
APVIIPVVNDWLNDCGESGAPAAAGGETPGNDGLPTPTAEALGGNDVGPTVLGSAGGPGIPRGPP